MTEDQARAVVFDTLGEIAPEGEADAIDPDYELIEQLDIDSMDFLNLMLGIQRRTGIEIPERDYAQLTTLKGCVVYLVDRSAA